MGPIANTVTRVIRLNNPTSSYDGSHCQMLRDKKNDLCTIIIFGDSTRSVMEITIPSKKLVARCTHGPKRLSDVYCHRFVVISDAT